MTRSRIVLTLILALMVFIAGVVAATNTREEKRNRVRNPPPYFTPAAAAELQQKLFVADLHADSLLWGRNLLTRSTTGARRPAPLQPANVALQVFTVVTTSAPHQNIERN